MTMEKEMEQQEKRLQELLIRRFIFTLIIVGVVEFVLTSVSDRFIMPMIADRFFPDYEMSDSFSTLALSGYAVSAIAGGLINIVCGILPETVRIPAMLFINSVVSSKENSLFISGEGMVIANMTLVQRLLLMAVIAGLLTVLAVPYVIGAVRFVIVTMREFRKIGAMRMQARKDYEQRRNLMISDMAHDLRTPVTTISGYAQALADGLVSDEDRQTYLNAIKEKSAGLNDLIQLLFDYTRIDSEGFELKRQRTDVCETVRSCAAALYTDAEKAGMDMDVSISETVIDADIDVPQFKRVINNLIVNAIRHNQKGCCIGIVVSEARGGISIAVADKGEPIPADKAGHLFEPFFMGDESRNSRGGSGLGLSIAKKITDMHGYRLRLIQGKELHGIERLKEYSKAFVIDIPY